MSDRTHPSNLAGAKIEFTLYMTIGNPSSKIRQMPSTHNVILVTFLPIPIKTRNIPHKRLDEQRHTNRKVLNNVLRQVLQPLTFKHNPNARSGYKTFSVQMATYGIAKGGIRQMQGFNDGTREDAKGTRGIKCCNLDAVHNAAPYDCLAGLYQPRDRWFQGVGCRHQLSKHPLDVSLGENDLSIWNLATVSHRETWTSTQNEPEGCLECLQTQYQLPAASDHLSASYSLLRDQRAQSRSSRSASGEQCCRQQNHPFRCWSGCPPGLPVICEARIHGAPKQRGWRASWGYDQRLRSISQQCTRRNTPRGNTRWNAGVYQAHDL